MTRLISKRSKRPNTSVSSRVVRHNRWIHRNQITVGMYVAELDRPWSDTRFMFQGFRIESQKMLEAVQASCEYALVESEKLAQVSSNSMNRLCGAGKTSQFTAAR